MMNMTNTKHVIDVELRNYEHEGVEALAQVTIDKAIQFLVTLRYYADKETGEKKLFYAYPKRKNGEKWEETIHLETELKQEIEKAIGIALREDILRPQLEIQSVTIKKVNQDKTLEKKPIVRGFADVQLPDMCVKGIMIKEGKHGYFINMPQYRNAEGQYRDIVHNTSRTFWKQLQEAVMGEYEK